MARQVVVDYDMFTDSDEEDNESVLIQGAG
jgi:hypothetical protein